MNFGNRNFFNKIGTFRRLGIKNIAVVAAYRLALSLGIHPVTRIKRRAPKGIFYDSKVNISACSPSMEWKNSWLGFGQFVQGGDSSIPNWHGSLGAVSSTSTTAIPWWTIPDFASGTDIKEIWEFSRFDWLVCMAQRATCGDQSEIIRMNQWLIDWCASNPPYFGPNWKCGQEASFRVIHLVLACAILGKDGDPKKELLDLVEIHLARIAPTISYARAQDNNHATSEAAALFIGGSWLGMHRPLTSGRKWEALGRLSLERAVARCFLADGSFSQHSTNYHRLALDTLSLAEWWRIRQSLSPWSNVFYKRAASATNWLHTLVEPSNGDVPNLGSNDGACLLWFGGSNIRDFRPSVQIAAAFFLGRRAYADCPIGDNACTWLSLLVPNGEPLEYMSKDFPFGGITLLRARDCHVLFRKPVYRFRPCHADALHVDLWIRGKNIFRDGGTFSYAASEIFSNYFPGTVSHCTIEFDDRDQMPRLGRFLFGSWLSAQEQSVNLSDPKKSATASYKDRYGVTHCREISLHQTILEVKDTVSGFKSHAILRWRLCPGNWSLTENGVEMEGIKVRVLASENIENMSLQIGWESRLYLERIAIPVLEVRVSRACRIVTTVEWKP